MSAIRNSGVSVFQGVVKCAINGMYCSDYALCPHYSVCVSGERGSTVCGHWVGARVLGGGGGGGSSALAGGGACGGIAFGSHGPGLKGQSPF